MSINSVLGEIGRRTGLSALPLTGVYLAVFLFVLTFTPSLIPRSALYQGVLAGVGLALGFGLGVLLERIWTYLELPVMPTRQWHVVNLVLLLAVLVFAGFYLLNAVHWQNAVRDEMGMESVNEGHYVTMLLVAAVLSTLLILIGWGVVLGVSAASRWTHRHVPRRISSLLGALLFIVALVVIVNGTLVSGVITLTDKSLAALDVTDPPGFTPPVLDTRSAGPKSTIAWDGLGRQGKVFVSEGPTQEEIEAFTGEPALDPIRAYVGLRAADSPDEQAEMALQELIALDAFSRSVLIIATPTGTGWIDNWAFGPLEYMHGGDVATVAVQYSYLLSPLSLMLEPGRVQESAAAVFPVIYRHWHAMPKETRPKLYLFGLSLGSLGSESSMPVYALLGDPIQGAVWVGPPFRNPIWRAMRRNRNEGSPDWKPTFEDGSTIRVIGAGDTAREAPAPWGSVRIVYLAYPSDAIAFFEERMFLRPPEWLSDPRGPDVSPLLSWVPIVTALQVAVDMNLATNVPVQHGHNYGAQDYIEAWRAVTEPAAFDDEDAKRLLALFPGSAYD
ncbi:alpha/beta-hydrolase family protein [Pseudoruegeria sp. HB172150]|uniref:alpha/beta hydrolase n=1 Tax=Pseudoruegeria sp. HB172150 TaxID=2721164 RepID=UPI001553894E|nr:alpha/beta-hydrolase family protein [Pseudoruegeria sp. HB172150]